MATKYIYSDGTGPKLNGTQLFFRTVTRYQVDNNGKVVGSPVTGVYYTTKGGGRSSTGEIWTPGDINDPSGFNQGGYVFAAVTTDKGKTFLPTYYTQNDADKGLIPFGKNIGDPVLSPTALQSLNDPNGVLNQAIQNSIINTAVKTQPGLAAQLAAKLSNTQPDPQAPAPTAPGGSGGSGAGTNPTSTPMDVEMPGVTEQKVGSYGQWIYPEGLGDNRQDFIEFMMFEYGGRKLGGFNPTSGLADRNINTKNILGRVWLPIQPTISDMSSVDWQNDNINPLQVLGAEASRDLQNGTFTEAQIGQLMGMAASEDVKRYIQLWAAGKAVGTNLLSRFSGAVVNPNMELLFNGPQLRPFNFSFRLSPRNEREAKQVKGIIRFFKKGMAVRKTDQELFLKTPNVFKIIYRNGNNKNQEHTSINNIKICALTQCSVDYTPDGSYSTFYDKESTMTSYGLTLQFNELEPIFNEDYGDLSNKTKQSVIGY
jgi:hypothetical protein